jgi:hypothetical protein
LFIRHFARGLAAALYLRSTRARDRVGRLGLVGLLAFLVVAHLGAAFGPPPPSVTAVVASGVLGFALLVPWAGWVDRHRSAIGGAR